MRSLFFSPSTLGNELMTRPEKSFHRPPPSHSLPMNWWNIYFMPSGVLTCANTEMRGCVILCWVPPHNRPALVSRPMAGVCKSATSACARADTRDGWWMEVEKTQNKRKMEDSWRQTGWKQRQDKKEEGDLFFSACMNYSDAATLLVLLCSTLDVHLNCSLTRPFMDRSCFMTPSQEMNAAGIEVTFDNKNYG